MLAGGAQIRLALRLGMTIGLLLAGVSGLGQIPATVVSPVPGATLSSAATPAEITSPANGTRLPGSTVTFTWTQGTGVTGYVLWLGTQSATHNLFYGSVTGTSVTVTNLPNSGITVYARLYSKMNGVWQYVSYNYLAASPQPAELLSPAPFSQVRRGPVTFKWSSGYEVTNYTLCLGSTSGQCDLWQWSGNATSTTVSNLASNGATIYATLTSTFGSQSQSLYYTYVAPGTTQVSAIAEPDHGTGLSRTFRFLYDWRVGSAPFQFVDVRIGVSQNDAATCALTYDLANHSLRFSGNPTSYILGSQQTLSNSACSALVQSSLATQTGTQLLLALDLQFLKIGASYSVFTRQWSGASATGPASSSSAWQQAGTWKVAAESWPVVDKSQYASAGAAARQTYLNSGYDYHYWTVKYAPLGSYFNLENSFGSFVTKYPLDAEGFPMPDGSHYNIVTLAQFALCRWGRSLSGAEPSSYFLAVADKLVSLTQPDGSIPYLYAAIGQNPPWTSGMAQGVTLSVLARAYALTSDPKYLAAGKLVLDHMVQLRSSSGDRSDLGDVSPSLNGYSIIEEAPRSSFSTHVLNGFEFGIIGLNDWAAITGDLKAKLYFDSCIGTLQKAFTYWDLGDWTNYDLNYLIPGSVGVDPAFAEYQGLHIALQDTLGQITGNSLFNTYRDRWIQQVETLQQPPFPP